MLASSSFGARHTAETPRLVLEFADFWFFHPQCFASGALEGRSEHVAGGAPHPARRIQAPLERPETLAAHAPGPAEGKRSPGCQNSLTAHPAASPGEDRT